MLCPKSGSVVIINWHLPSRYLVVFLQGEIPQGWHAHLDESFWKAQTQEQDKRHITQQATR